MNSTSTTTQTNCPSGSTDYVSIILGTLFAASELFSLVDRIKPNGITEAVAISIKNILQAFVTNTNVVQTSNTNVLPTANTNVLPTELPTSNTNVLPTSNTNVLPTSNTNVLPTELQSSPLITEPQTTLDVSQS